MPYCLITVVSIRNLQENQLHIAVIDSILTVTWLHQSTVNDSALSMAVIQSTIQPFGGNLAAG